MTDAGGRYFEDFTLGETIRHPTPRTLTAGDAALYQALYGSRFATQSSDPFAWHLGYEGRAPLDDLLVFHVVFGKTVTDISLNAVANLGYAECRFIRPVYAGETLVAVSEVIGLKQVSAGDAGIVYVRSTALNDYGTATLSFVRWVMVRKRDRASPAPSPHVPELDPALAVDDLGAAVPGFASEDYDNGLAGSDARFDDFSPGQRIDHRDGMTIEESEHQMATRLYQNNARVHFDAFTARDGRFGRRLVYGGHVISMARSLSYNGLQNAFHISGINGGRHVAPCFAGDTIFAWSEVVETADLPGRNEIGAVRLRTVATKDRPCADFPLKDRDGNYDPAVVLDLDYWALMPR